MAISRILVYLACPYSYGETAPEEDRKENIEIADFWGKKLWSMGFVVIHPIRNDIYVAELISYEQIMKADLVIIDHCNMIFMCPGWQMSEGTKREYEHAKKIEKSVMYWQDYSSPKHSGSIFKCYECRVELKEVTEHGLLCCHLCGRRYKP